MTSSFADLGLSSELLDAVRDIGFEEPSPIQELAIPVLLDGHDAVGQAQTGTGKTAAFGIPILEKVLPEKTIQALILCPTRELTIQVAEEIGRLGSHKKNISVLPVYGGQPIERQIRSLRDGVQIVVGTPGRMLDHLERGTISLDSIRITVLDEADEMLDMGFREDIEAILAKTPEEGQRVLFSATMPRPILELSRKFLRDPAMLTIVRKTMTVPAIEQIYYEVRPHQKLETLCRVLDVEHFRKALVFCATKRAVDEIAVNLQQRGYSADGLHGDLNQTQRDRVMSRFRSEHLEILIATDVAARGIDVDDVDAVINYDMPNDVENYVHRIGRTGRAQRQGKAFTLVTAREHYRLRDIIRFTRAKIVQKPIPTLQDLNTVRMTRLFSEVKEVLDAGVLESCMIQIENFLEESFPDGEMTSRDVAAALLKLLKRKEFGNVAGKSDDSEDFAEEANAFSRRAASSEAYASSQRRRSTSMTSLLLNIGHLSGATPKAIVGAITGECGIPGNRIGAISIRTRATIVEVASSLAESVAARLNQGVFIGGVRIVAKIDSTPGGSVRRPFPPSGSRGRQRSAQQGRKYTPDQRQTTPESCR
ncbi:MAG: DEAD/DEAH box helicase [Desulfovibrionaceae bacterium]|nr:DEAD/DEAH box helicase [Desulfovibrionaceae bacterium]